jgi:hypothetical protein
METDKSKGSSLHCLNFAKCWGSKIKERKNTKESKIKADEGFYG